MGTIDNLHFSVKFDIFPINDRVLRKQSQKRDEINMPERVNKRPTTAKEALVLVQKGKAEYISTEHADPFIDATSNSVFIPKTGLRAKLLRDGTGENVDLGEFRPRTGTVVVPGSLRERQADTLIEYEKIGEG